MNLRNTILCIGKEDVLTLLGIYMSVMTVLLYMRYGLYHPGGQVFAGYYAKLGHAFLAGQTALLEQPPQRLLDLPNPYNYFSRISMRLMWDTSLYNGRYYLYFGPAPVLFPWIPVYLLTGIALLDQQLCVLLTSMASVCLIWLTIAIARLRQPTNPYAVLFILLPVCFATWIPLLLRRPLFYEVAIAGAYFYTAFGIFCLWRSLSCASKYKPYWQLVAGFSIGMAAGCRPFYAFAMIIPASMWFQHSLRRSWLQSLREGILLCAPFALCLAALGAYNYARFDSIFENGFRYQITGRDFHKSYAGLWNKGYFWNHAYEYLFKPLPTGKITPWAHRFGVVTIEPAYGLFTNSPFALWSLWFAASIVAVRAWLSRYYGLIIGVTLFALGMSYFIFCFDTVANRYMVDFSPWVMLLAGIGFLQALGSGNTQQQKHLLVAGGILALWSAYVGLANSYCGHQPCIQAALQSMRAS